MFSIAHTQYYNYYLGAEERKQPAMDAGDKLLVDLSEVLLKLLAEKDSFDSYNLSKELGKDHQQVVGVIKSLQSLGNVSHCITASQSS